jgi:hypothetical protein
MIMNIRNILYIVTISTLIMACNNGPKVITAQSNPDPGEITGSGIFSEDNINKNIANGSGSTFNENLHTVVVNEILPSSKYVYLNVTEGGEQFWIATGKQEIIIGDSYFYRKGLLKTNYESKEHNRVFEKIFLVSNLVAENHGNNTGLLKADFTKTEKREVQKEDIPTHTEKIIRHQGSIKIAEIVANPNKYEGKTVQITGKCVKVNPNIMERNWIHLQDGSKDEFDLVVTSNTFVPEGMVVTIRALVSLNRDFGAGYRYDLILENGTVIE